jgi:hypothetical protein
MHDELGPDRAKVVALLCRAPRLRRILRLALESEGQAVLEWTDPDRPPHAAVSVIVVDLDSLG